MSITMVNEAIAQLRKKYALSLPLKVSNASECVAAALKAPWNRSLGEMAHRFLHSLIGSSGTYGFPQLSEVARSAEVILKASVESGAPLSPGEGLRLHELVTRLGFLAAREAEDAAGRAA
jgi:HPt (histidine-containing phosphotransfer) domain-containing protein